MVLLIFMAIERHYAKLFLLTALEKAHFKLFYSFQKNFLFHSANLQILIKLLYHTHYMFINVESLAQKLSFPRNKYNKNRTADNWDAFRRQRNFCVKLSRKVKRDFYNQLDISEVTDNKKF